MRTPETRSARHASDRPEASFDAMVPGSVLARLADAAFAEDLGPRGIDATSDAIARIRAHDADRPIRARLVARESCVVAGLPTIPALAHRFASGVQIEQRAHDGDRVTPGAVLAEIRGSGVLVLERTMLNLLSRLSGIATRTRAFVDAIPPGTRARLYDTRKTTPGLRELEKYAVRCGGGYAHRMGLHDAVLIKDNHLSGVGDDGLASFVERVAGEARRAGPIAFVMVEVDRHAQIERILALPAGVVDIVLLDNMGIDDVRTSVAMRDARNPGVQLEASGGVTLDTIGAIARAGVDRISVGSITHGARSVDLALDVVAEGGA